MTSIFFPFSPDELAIYWPILLEGAMVSIALGLVGCFLVVRGTSLLGDALAHSVLPGIVVGFLIGGSLHSPWILIGATAFGMLAAFLVETVEKQSRVKEDASLGIIFTSLFALGVVMINVFAGHADLDANCVLYGNLEYFIAFDGATPSGIWPMLYILLGIIAALLLFYRQLLVSTFDPGLAISLGIPATLVHYVVMAALSLTVVASFEAVGAILAVALLIMPGATARLWTDRMPRMLLIAAAHGIASTVIGYWLSHEAIINTSASGAIAVAGFGLFIGSWLFVPRRGLLTQKLVRRRLKQTIAIENLLKAIEEHPAPAIGRAELANLLKQPEPAFEKLLRRATKPGLIVATPGGELQLTPAGQKRSAELTRAHLLWEKFLETQVGIAPDHVHDAAEWIEHHLSVEAVRQIDEALSSTTG
jgi:manganese/zinc/iron transport system permease protein